MELTRTLSARGLLLGVDGRIDGYWSDHLDVALDEAVREGHHRITLDCEKVNFISSAGIGVLMKHHKELTHIGGAFVLVNASQPVRKVLQISRLSELLLSGASAETTAPAVAASRTIDANGLHLELFELDARATLACRPFGSAEPLAQGRFRAEQCVALANVSPRFAVGVGAFGDSFDECRGRFGELVAVQGATAYQPADGTNVPDYLLTQGGPGTDVRMLYGLGAHGAFAHLVRFEPASRGATVSLSQLIGACLDATGASALGVVVVAETEGLVGAALRRSPAQPIDEGDFFSHPAVRTRLSFTPARTFPHGVSLTAGFVSRGDDSVGHGQFRAMGGSLSGHLHAAAFRFQPIQRGPIDLGDTLGRLFEPGQLQGVVHLLNDDRGATGAGESAFIRGACWIAPLA